MSQSGNSQSDPASVRAQTPFGVLSLVLIMMGVFVIAHQLLYASVESGNKLVLDPSLCWGAISLIVAGTVFQAWAARTENGQLAQQLEEAKSTALSKVGDEGRKTRDNIKAQTKDLGEKLGVILDGKEKLLETGLCEALPARDVLNRLFSEGTREVRWLDTYNPNLLVGAVTQFAQKDQTKVKMLVLDPGCRNAYDRHRELRDSWSEEFLPGLQSFWRRIRTSMHKLNENGESGFEAHTYDDLPCAAIYLREFRERDGDPIQREAFFSLFLTRATADEEHFRVKEIKDVPNSLYGQLSKYFDDKFALHRKSPDYYDEGHHGQIKEVANLDTDASRVARRPVQADAPPPPVDCEPQKPDQDPDVDPPVVTDKPAIKKKRGSKSKNSKRKKRKSR